MKALRLAGLALLVALLALPAGAQAPAAPTRTPSIDDPISLKRVTSAELSPDGKLVAYTVRETNWDDNAYQTSIGLADVGASKASGMDLPAPSRAAR